MFLPSCHSLNNFFQYKLNPCVQVGCCWLWSLTMTILIVGMNHSLRYTTLKLLRKKPQLVSSPSFNMFQVENRHGSNQATDRGVKWGSKSNNASVQAQGKKQSRAIPKERLVYKLSAVCRNGVTVYRLREVFRMHVSFNITRVATILWCSLFGHRSPAHSRSGALYLYRYVINPFSALFSNRYFILLLENQFL